MTFNTVMLIMLVAFFAQLPFDAARRAPTWMVVFDCLLLLGVIAVIAYRKRYPARVR
jgi:hypothetical protein